MKQVSKLIDASLFFLFVFLTTLVIFESFVVLPGLLQVAGRLHPLVLHLPIGIFATLALLPAIKSNLTTEGFHHIQLFLVRLGVLSLFIAAIAGFFLAQEPGYESGLVDQHKWGAMASSYLGYGLFSILKKFPTQKRLYQGVLFLNLIALVVTGHLGGTLTHGKDYLIEPIKKESALVITPDSKVFDDVIQPILKEKCIKCHNRSKQKGGLSMVSPATLVSGGESGPLWIAGQPDSSLMLQRIHLPLTAEEHMPPEGQAQLSQQEIKLIHHWIKAGADWELEIEALNQQDSLYLALQPLLEDAKSIRNEEMVYNFEAAPPRTIEALSTPYRSINPIAQHTPALEVAFFLQEAFQPSYLEELSEVREQVVSINLSNMPITDEDLSLISPFTNLEQLVLNGTKISGATLDQLVRCTQLKEIALSDTPIDQTHLLAFAKLPQLKRIYAWETAVRPTDLAKLAQDLPGVKIELGYQASPEEILQLSPPLLTNDQAVLAEAEQVILSTKFPGAEIRYTTDGSDPDSLSSPLFSTPFVIHELTHIKAQTYSPGWLASKIAEYVLFPAGKTPDTTILLTQPNPQYRGMGARTITDQQKGKINNFRTPAWLGYQEETLSILFGFGDEPPQLQKIVGSFGQNIGPEIFLPKEVRVYGGSNPDQMNLLGQVNPTLPDGYQANKIEGVTLEWEATRYPFYRLEARPHPRLPRWHQAYDSGRKSWIFIDEVFFY
jgi:hypothetical protein